MSQVVKNPKEKGYTLVEILIVLFLLGMLMVPMFLMMDKSYSTGNEEKQKQMARDDFRLFSAYLLDDLLYARDFIVQNHPTYDVLSFTTNRGSIQTILFDSESGVYRERNGEQELLVKGERYEAELPMVYVTQDGVIHFNFYAREINVLFLTSIQPRLNGGI